MCVLGVNIGDFAEVVIRKWGVFTTWDPGWNI